MIDDEEIEQKKEERKKRGQDINWDVVLNVTAAAPLVIVDGYNIIYSWPRLKKHMVKGDLQRARELLIDDLENLRSLKGWRIEVVFDGTGKSYNTNNNNNNNNNIGGPLLGQQGYKSRVTTAAATANHIDESKHGVRVVFTGRGIEADSYIQSRCVAAKRVTEGSYTGSFIVATDDGMIRIAGQNAGALCMGAERFVDELKSMKKAIGYRVEAAMAKVNGHAIRPEQLHGTTTTSTSMMIHNFGGRRSVLIEDKRERQRERLEKKRKEQEEADKYIMTIESKMKNVHVVDYTKVPNQTKTFP
jgi:predicted RNA-binding protein with PIN domain